LFLFSCFSLSFLTIDADRLPADMMVDGILDLYRVKRQILHSATVLASQLLLVDEVLRATGPAGGPRQQ
jgi:chaperonin GroEL (HSP60 family)